MGNTNTIDYDALAKKYGATSSGVDYDAIAKKYGASSSSPAAGEMLNDVGNKIIVPMQGESFADTMNRAATYGKIVTQEMRDREMATAPKKAAQTLLAAPVIGAALPAAAVGTSAMLPETYVGASTIPRVGSALLPIAAKWGIRALEGVGMGAAAGVGWHLYNELKKVFEP